jgi:hypothetical protein
MIYICDYQPGVGVPQGYEPRHLGVREKKLNWNPIIGLFIYSYNTQIWNNSNYINYKHFVDKYGTIYEKRLPRGTQVKKMLVTADVHATEQVRNC